MWIGPSSYQSRPMAVHFAAMTVVYFESPQLYFFTDRVLNFFVIILYCMDIVCKKVFCSSTARKILTDWAVQILFCFNDCCKVG